jgi:hypothetical protein
MSCFHRYMGLSHLDVGFRHYLQRGIALAGSASHSAAQTLSQMVVIHAAFHGAGQVSRGPRTSCFPCFLSGGLVIR